MEQVAENFAELSRMIEQTPDNAKALAQRGKIYCQLEYYQEALADFNRAIELNPDYVWTFAYRGETHRLMGCYAEALVDFNRAIELKSEYAWALAHRGVTHRLMGRYEAALADLDQAIGLQPDYAWAIVHRTDIYVIMRRYEEALIDADRAIALDETIVSHWRGERGMVLNALGRYAETIACCEQALRENSNDHIAWYSLVVAKVRLHSVAEAQADIHRARTVLLRAAECSKTQPGALYRLGGLAALEGKGDRALDYLQKAIPLDDEPGEMARHDPAWLNLRDVPRFQALVVKQRG